MLTRDQILDGDLVWLLTLDFAGRTWRYATERVDVESVSAEGAETYAFSPGLTPLDDVVQALAAVSSTPQRRSQSVDLAWDDVGSATSLARLIQDGHDLASGRAEVALWARGTRWEERIVVVEGLIREPEYGARSESCAFTVEDEPWDDVARLVSGATATSDLWPNVHPDAIGAVYPFVFGQPGYFRDASGTARTGGSPAICVTHTSAGILLADTLLIAGHHVDAGTVYVIYRDDAVGGFVQDGPYTVTNTVDGNGVPIATISVSGAATALRTAGKWWISWSEGAAYPSRYHAGAGVRTLGELLRTLADLSAVRTQGGEWAAVETLLPWPVGGYVDDPNATPLGYLQDALLPLAPIGLATGDEGGLVPALWRYEASAGDAIDHVEVGPGISRVGRVRYERAPRDVVQRITVNYAHSASRNDYARTLDLRPDPVEADATTNAQCIAADLRYRRPGEVLRSVTIDAAIVWSEVTAARVAHWRIRRDGYSPRLVDYDVGSDRAWLQVGDVVTLTDSEIEIEDVVCLVVERRISDIGRWRLTFQILDGLYSDGTYAPTGRHGGPTWTDLGN